MSRLKSALLGYYIPSFFEMHVNTTQEDMTINHLPLNDMITLFHEYIHFLQDFTTYYGLNGIYIHSEYLHSVVTRLYALHRNDVKVPFEIKDNTDKVLLNREIRNFTLGDDSGISNFNIIDIQEAVDDLTNPEASLSSIPNVILSSDNDNMVVFGAMAIMESMAYIMERLCSPDYSVKSPDFPYMAAEKVADYYVSDFSNDLLMVLALCDMSLMTSNPGFYFVDVMKNIRDGNLSFKTPEEIYDHFYSQEVSHIDGRQGSFLASYKELLECVEKQMKSYLRDMSVAKQYYEWIDRLVAFAIDWRENDRCFLLKMASNHLPQNGCFGKAVRDVGTPLISNNNPGKYYKVIPYGIGLEMDVEYFKVFYEIEKVFEYASTECSLYEWCTRSPNATPNEYCKSAPWRNCNEQKLCPFALVWKHWNLSTIIPKK